MRKDYMPAGDDHLDETAFVEQYWTKVWEQQGGPKGQVNKIPTKEEYRIMRPYLAALPQGARVLDGGCGLGDWTARLTAEGFQALGLDISRQTVEQLRSIFPDVAFAVGDIRDTGLEFDSFDAYFSWGVFEHFEEGPRPCLREAYRLLKPGGILFISTPMDNLRHALRDIFSRATSPALTEPQRFYQYRFTPVELSREAAMQGFDVMAAKTIHKRQGVLRALHHTFGLPYGWLLTRGLAFLLAPILPGRVFAHMVLVVARKP